MMVCNGFANILGTDVFSIGVAEPNATRRWSALETLCEVL